MGLKIRVVSKKSHFLTCQVVMYMVKLNTYIVQVVLTISLDIPGIFRLFLSIFDY